ncbi:hypothetical protein U1Q18_010113, partial [Sarracenia purpurea var. burkii]
DIVKNVIEPSSSSDPTTLIHVAAPVVLSTPPSVPSLVASTEIMSLLLSIQVSQQAFQTKVR